MKITDLYTTDIHDEGSEVRILDGDGNETPLYIKVAGMDSIVFRAQAKAQQKAYIEALRQNKDKDFDDEEMIVNGLVECTLGWRGTDQKFSKKLCKELYKKAPFVKDQVDRFIGDRANFTKAKPKK